MSEPFGDHAGFSLDSLSTTIFDSVTSGISIADPRQDDCPLVYVNPSFTRITGYEANEVVGRNCRFLQGQETDPKAVDHLRRALSEGREASVTLLNYRKDGVKFWNELRVSPVRDQSGDVVLFVGVQNDITGRLVALQERDRIADQLDALLGSTGEGIYGIDTRGIFTFVNTAGARMLGGEPNDFIGLDSHGLVHHTRSDGSVYPIEECPIYRAFETGTGCRVDGDCFWRRDGTSFPTDYSSFPIVHHGAVTGAVVAFSDISVRKAAEAKLQQALDAADQASAAKSQFLATMSHELRTPLNAIIGYSEMLQEEAGDAAMPEFVLDLGKINRAGRQLLSLINNVLDLSKIEADKTEIFVEACTVAEIVADVVDTVSPLVEGNGNALTVELDDVSMQTDAAKVRQSLINLLSNASKFTQNGEIVLTVSTFVDASQEFVRFSVRDSGIGIPDAHLERLFEPFDQGDISLTSRYGGTGLGLSITRSFCRLLGGDVTVASELGRGSVFTMTLPRVMGDERSENLQDATAEQPLVMVIADLPKSAGIAKSLRIEQVQTLSTASVAEAVRLASDRSPVVIVVDAAISEDGAMEVLRTDPATAKVPVVLLVEDGEQELAATPGSVDALTMPVNSDGLRPLVRRLLRGADRDVLVVDDDATTRGMLRARLERDGLRVADAAGGDQAIAELRRGRFSVVLLDLLMPGTDGIEVIKAMKSEPKLSEISIVVITAKDITSDDRQWLDRHVSAIFQKGSYSREDLLSEIRSHLALVPEATFEDDACRS